MEVGARFSNTHFMLTMQAILNHHLQKVMWFPFIVFNNNINASRMCGLETREKCMGNSLRVIAEYDSC